MIRSISLTVILLLATTAMAQQDAQELAEQVMKVSGADVWPKVKRIQFTFNVESGGKMAISAKHDWNLRDGTDTVTWNGKTVTVDLSQANGDGDAKAAYQRWTNDSYWLLAPLKLKDGGVTLAHNGTQQVDGAEYLVLHLTFQNVGLTPGDQYNLYIDPQTHLVRLWDYMPSPEKSLRATWEEYQNFNGLTLSTSHQMGERTIRFTDVSVETE